MDICKYRVKLLHDGRLSKEAERIKFRVTPETVADALAIVTDYFDTPLQGPVLGFIRSGCFVKSPLKKDWEDFLQDWAQGRDEDYLVLRIDGSAFEETFYEAAGKEYTLLNCALGAAAGNMDITEGVVDELAAEAEQHVDAAKPPPCPSVGLSSACHKPTSFKSTCQTSRQPPPSPATYSSLQGSTGPSPPKPATQPIECIYDVTAASPVPHCQLPASTSSHLTNEMCEHPTIQVEYLARTTTRVMAMAEVLKISHSMPDTQITLSDGKDTFALACGQQWSKEYLNGTNAINKINKLQVTQVVYKGWVVPRQVISDIVCHTEIGIGARMDQAVMGQAQSMSQEWIQEMASEYVAAFILAIFV